MIDYGAVVTKLQGTEIKVTESDRALAVWLIKKFSSLTYIRRMSSLYFNFVGGYEDFAKRKKTDAQFYRINLSNFFIFQSFLRKGLDLLEGGYTVGYPPIYRGSKWGGYLSGNRFEGGEINEP